MVCGEYCVIKAINWAGWRVGGQRKRIWECEGGSQRKVGLAEGEAAGAGVAGDGKGLGRHVGTAAAQEEALGPKKGDGVSGGFWRSRRLTSSPGYPAGGKERSFFSRSMPRAAVWRSHRYSGFGELLRPSKTGGKRKVAEVPH